MLALAGCGGDDGGLPESTSAALETYARIVHASYEDSAAAARAMAAYLRAAQRIAPAAI